MNGFILVLIISIIISILISVLLRKKLNTKYLNLEKEAEVKKLKTEISHMENQHYMLSLDVEKSRQKLTKSVSFLESLKEKTKDANIEEMKKHLEEK